MIHFEQKETFEETRSSKSEYQEQVESGFLSFFFFFFPSRDTLFLKENPESLIYFILFLQGP
jgi:hypothetical protein